MPIILYVPLHMKLILMSRDEPTSYRINGTCEDLDNLTTTVLIIVTIVTIVTIRLYDTYEVPYTDYTYA